MIYVGYAFLIIFVVYILLSLILGFMCFNNFLKVRKRRDYFDEKYLSKRYINGNLIKMKEYNENNNYINVDIKSDDNINLHARLLLKNDKRFVILIHGFRSISNRLLEYAKFYDEHDFSVLLVDLRGHGYSDGHYIGMGYKDKYDIEEFIKYLKLNYGDDIEIVIHGFSMGAATTMNVIKDNDPCIKFAVEDCGFTNSRWELKYKLRHDYHIPATPLYEFAYLFYLIATGNRYQKLQPIKSVKETNIPLLIVHGEKDTFVPVRHAYKLNEVCNSYHEMLIVKDAPHTMSYKFDNKTYEEYLLKFIDKFIKK